MKELQEREEQEILNDNGEGLETAPNLTDAESNASQPQRPRKVVDPIKKFLN